MSKAIATITLTAAASSVLIVETIVRVRRPIGAHLKARLHHILVHCRKLVHQSK